MGAIIHQMRRCRDSPLHFDLSYNRAKDIQLRGVYLHVHMKVFNLRVNTAVKLHHIFQNRYTRQFRYTSNRFDLHQAVGFRLPAERAMEKTYIAERSACSDAHLFRRPQGFLGSLSK